MSVRRGTVEENAPAGDLAAASRARAAAGTTQISLPNVENGHDDRSDLLGLVVQCRTTTPLALVRKFPRASVWNLNFGGNFGTIFARYIFGFL